MRGIDEQKRLRKESIMFNRIKIHHNSKRKMKVTNYNTTNKKN